MELKFLLEKYKDFGSSQKRIKEITQTIFNTYNILLESNDILIKDSQIKINISGVKKMEFFLNKTKIQEDLLLEFKKENISISEIF